MRRLPLVSPSQEPDKSVKRPAASPPRLPSSGTVLLSCPRCAIPQSFPSRGRVFRKPTRIPRTMAPRRLSPSVWASRSCQTVQHAWLSFNSSNFVAPMWAVVSMRIESDPDPRPSPDGQRRVYIKNYSENKGVLERLIVAGAVKDTNKRARQAYIEAPLVDILVPDDVRCFQLFGYRKRWLNRSVCSRKCSTSVHTAEIGRDMARTSSSGAVDVN